MRSFSRAAARCFWLPLLLLLIAWQAGPQLLALPPPELAGSMPYAAAALALAAALLLRRPRLAWLALLPALGYWLLGLDGDPFRSTWLATACALLLPLNLFLLGALAERGPLGGAATRLGLLAIETGFLALGALGRREDWLALLRHEFFPAPELLGLAQPALAALALAMGLQLWRLLRSPSAPEAALLVAMPVTAAACAGPLPELWLSAAILMLLGAAVQHTHHIAYRDELTGLPGRRALTEQLAALGRRYTIAMLDVDHFKKFNDTYGHDVGDQVLRMVASQLRRVGGRGRAFRYGGEEFSVVFPGRDPEQALPHLEDLREAIAGYALALRAPDRPARGRAGRGSGAKRGTVRVTVSIGLAGSTPQRRNPEAVLRAADQALYRAKKAGRNRVCT